jgi:hypothetical protein
LRSAFYLIEFFPAKLGKTLTIQSAPFLKLAKAKRAFLIFEKLKRAPFLYLLGKARVFELARHLLP